MRSAAHAGARYAKALISLQKSRKDKRGGSLGGGVSTHSRYYADIPHPFPPDHRSISGAIGGDRGVKSAFELSKPLVVKRSETRGIPGETGRLIESHIPNRSRIMRILNVAMPLILARKMARYVQRQSCVQRHLATSQTIF